MTAEEHHGALIMNSKEDYRVTLGHLGYRILTLMKTLGHWCHQEFVLKRTICEPQQSDSFFCTQIE